MTGMNFFQQGQTLEVMLAMTIIHRVLSGQLFYSTQIPVCLLFRVENEPASRTKACSYSTSAGSDSLPILLQIENPRGKKKRSRPRLPKIFVLTLGALRYVPFPTTPATPLQDAQQAGYFFPLPAVS
jgi:hypothetical protein